ncbi:helix-turn-helix transcriptional regulator [Haladaptatus litoreus]|uniref:helix-turn-helix transcriptional regulator n=1 Tax=Haladaptatus litoreus TaxID=553468 RepID=UPI0009710894
MYPERIDNGQLYPGLDRLVEKGLITKRAKPSDKRREEYALTGQEKWTVNEYARFIQDIAD